MTKQTEALKMAIEWVEGWKGIAPSKIELLRVLREALEQPAQEVKCNPHPDAPHGFMRDESHSQDRYVCECEYWTPPAQEPVAWKHFDKAYSKACNSSQPQDWMDAALLAQQARNTHPAPSWQGLSDDEIIGLNPYAFVDNDIKFARAIEQTLKEKNT